MDRGRHDGREEELMFRNQMFFGYKPDQHQPAPHPHQQAHQPQHASPNFNDMVRYPDIRPRYPTSSPGYPVSNQPYPQPQSMSSSAADSSHLATMVTTRDLTNHSNHEAQHHQQQAQQAQPQQPQPPPQQQENPMDRDPNFFGDPDAEEDIIGSTFHEKLVHLMPEYSCLWNINGPAYKDKDRKKKSWDEISRRLGGIEVEYLKKEWEKLRDNYRKCIQRRERKRKKYGEASMKLPTCNFFQQLGFLAEVCGVKITKPPAQKTEQDFQELLETAKANSHGYRPILPNTSDIRQMKDMGKRKQQDLQAVVDTLFQKAKTSRLDQVNDPEASFLLSFAQTLKDMPTHKRQYAKMKISELFYNLTEQEDKDDPSKLTLP